MMRIMTPKGVVREVVKAVPVCELREGFNGGNRRLVEVADNLDAEPTAIAVKFRQHSNVALASDSEFFVGNLKPESVREVLQKLLADGYYDFSSMEYQKKVCEIKDTVFDKGKSLPYTSDFVTCCFFTGLCSPDNDPFHQTSIFDAQCAQWESFGAPCCEEEQYDEE